MMAQRSGKSYLADEDFYSSLAAGADSDESVADHQEMARSLGGLDDMEDDILGSLTKNKKTAKQPLSKTLPAKSSLSAPKSPAKKSSFNIDDIMGDDGNDLDSILAARPKTTDGPKPSSKTQDIFAETKPRPATTGQTKKTTKKIDFGEFDEDDPLAGLDLSDDDETPKPKKLNTKQNKRREPVASPQASPNLSPKASRDTGPQASPVLDEALPARPATRSGNRAADTESQFPVKARGMQSKAKGNDDGSDWDASSTSSAPATKETTPAPTAKPAAKKKEAVTFSDEDDDLDLGLEDGPPAKGKEKLNQSGGSMKDSLFGRSSSVEKHLQKPGTAGSQREFNLSDSKGLGTSGSARMEGKPPKSSTDDDDVFGSYAPSAMSSRPGTGRSVRFEDEEPKRPATADASMFGADDDWLGLGSEKQQKKRPLGLASTVDFASSAQDDDWLDMASSRPKTAPAPGLDKKPPRTPEKKAASAAPKVGGGDDWLAELTAKVDDEAEFVPKNLSRRSSVDKPFSRQSSLDSANAASRKAPTKQSSFDSVGSGGKKPTLARQSSSEDWLGLGAERPIEPVTPVASKPMAKTSTPKPPVVEDTDWLGLGTGSTTDKEDDTEQWIKSAKLRRQKSNDSILGDGATSKASGTFSLIQQTKPSDTLPWEEPAPKPATSHGVAAGSTFTGSAQSQLKPPTMPPTSQPVFQPMFVSAQPTVQPANQNWGQEQDSLLLQHQAQMEQMQQQFNQMVEMKRQQQQSALEQQKKLAEDAFKLQQQQLQASISGISPSPVFPAGLPPTKQSEIQLNNAELEGKVRRLEHEKSHLESLVESLKKRHQEETTAIETSNKARILMVEESYQRREFRLREEIEQISSESLMKQRHAEEEKMSLLSAQYRKIDELEKSKVVEIERMRVQHRQEVERMKEDHLQAINLLRKSKEQELEGLLSTTSNPQSLQFLMEQMKQSAAGLTALQFNIGKSHQVNLDERELTMNSRDQQLKVLQECLQRQQDENDKERSRLQELLAKMEIQLREQERQLHQEKWMVSQEKSKLSALQTAVEQERTLLNDQLNRERTELNRAKDSFLAEQRNAMVQLADERRILAEERSQLTLSQRMAVEREQEESLRQSQGSAKYEGLIKSMEAEREDLARRTKAITAEETKLAAERSSLHHEQEYVKKEQERLSELAQRIQVEMNSIESFSKDCVEKEREGKQALLESRRLDSSSQARLTEISSRLEELKSAEKRFAEERLQLSRERKQMDSLRSMQLCAGCKQPVTRNPYFSLSTPVLQSRVSPMSVGVVAPRQLDLTDPNILQYKIQADQDSSFLNEESAYLEALKYSPYHNKSLP